MPKWAVMDVKFADPQKNELLRESPRIKYANYCVIDNKVRLRRLKVQHAAAVARVERDYCAPASVHLEDGGTLGLSLLGLLAEAEHVILVDAVRADGPPGTLVRLDGADVSYAVRDRLSPHQVGVADLLDAARLIDSYPASVTLLGLVPDVIDLVFCH